MIDSQAQIVELQDLLEALKKAEKGDNFLDTRIELALFVPDKKNIAMRANNAGTKLIVTHPGEKKGTTYETTCSAWDNTHLTDSALRLLEYAYPEAKLVMQLPTVKGFEKAYADLTFDGVTYFGVANNLPMAICAAMLKLRLAQLQVPHG